MMVLDAIMTVVWWLAVFLGTSLAAYFLTRTIALAWFRTRSEFMCDNKDDEDDEKA